MTMSTPGLITPATPMSMYGGSHAPNTPNTAAGQRFVHRQSPPGASAGFLPRSTHPLNRHFDSVSDGSPMSPDAKRRRHLGPVAHPFARRESLPRPEFMPKPLVSIAAPPRPRNPGHRPAAAPSHSLVLPPLKTAHGPATHARSIEAMVMSIAPLNKLKVLAKICPPLAPPGPGSPQPATRGVVIAVDGSEHAAVKTMVSYLADFLARENEYRVRIWNSPGLDTCRDHPSLADYLALITHWHGISTEVVEHITTVPSPSSPSPVSPKTAPRPHRPADGVLAAADDAPPPRAPLPVAILPAYQLTLTDAAASRIPIADAYAPVDHWQWMATLWRGIVGPDITVVLRTAAAKGPAEGGQPSPKEVQQGVEIRLADARAILLTVDERGRVGDGGLRRVGFEVGEWVRVLEGARAGRRRS
jgi:hypothetical protein